MMCVHAVGNMQVGEDFSRKFPTAYSNTGYLASPQPGQVYWAGY